MGDSALWFLTRDGWAAVPFGFWATVFFILGTVVGSFLNVCIHRMPLDESIVSPPSHCPRCGYSIPWYLNVPLGAWLYLRGRCGNCGAPISIRYFLVELLTGLLFLGVWLEYGRFSPFVSIVFCIFLAGLLVATFTDFEHMMIPDQITWGGVGAGLLLSALVPDLHDASSWPRSLLSGFYGFVLGFGLLYGLLRIGKLAFGRQKIELESRSRLIFTEEAIHFPGEVIPYGELFYRNSDTVSVEGVQIELSDRCFWNQPVRLSPVKLEIGDEVWKTEEVPHMEVVCDRLVLPREAMGFGDVKLLGAIGAFLGPAAVLFTLMASSLLGSIVGIGGIVLRKQELSSKIPYGPYIALGAALWVLGGDGLRGWWLEHVEVFLLLVRTGHA